MRPAASLHSDDARRQLHRQTDQRLSRHTETGSLLHRWFVRPPVKHCACADHFALFDESDATIGKGFVETVDRLEKPVGQRLVDEGPQMLRRLQLGTVGRLKDEAHFIGNG